MVGNKHALNWLIDVASATFGALICYPLLLTCMSGNVFETYFEMRDMRSDMWIVYLGIESGPAALFGLLAARLFRRKCPLSHAAAAIAFFISMLMSAVIMFALGFLVHVFIPF